MPWLSEGLKRLNRFLVQVLCVLVFELVVQRSCQQLQLLEGAAMTTEVRRLVFDNVSEVFQLFVTHLALLVSPYTPLVKRL